MGSLSMSRRRAKFKSKGKFSEKTDKGYGDGYSKVGDINLRVWID
jgi:hypothetical protein